VDAEVGGCGRDGCIGAVIMGMDAVMGMHVWRARLAAKW